MTMGYVGFGYNAIAYRAIIGPAPHLICAIHVLQLNFLALLTSFAVRREFGRNALLPNPRTMSPETRVVGAPDRLRMVGCQRRVPVTPPWLWFLLYRRRRRRRRRLHRWLLVEVTDG